MIWVTDTGNELENQIDAFLQVSERFGKVIDVKFSDLGMTVTLEGKQPKYVAFEDLPKYLTKVETVKGA